jgi:hypothetical protein
METSVPSYVPGLGWARAQQPSDRDRLATQRIRSFVAKALRIPDNDPHQASEPTHSISVLALRCPDEGCTDMETVITSGVRTWRIRKLLADVEETDVKASIVDTAESPSHGCSCCEGNVEKQLLGCSCCGFRTEEQGDGSIHSSSAGPGPVSISQQS